MKASIIVQNLKCSGGAHLIRIKLSEMEAISNLRVDVDARMVSFKYYNETDAFEVKERLKSMGYPSIEDANSLSTKIKSLVSCASGKLLR
jgi:copper chaperone CopZ